MMCHTISIKRIYILKMHFHFYTIYNQILQILIDVWLLNLWLSCLQPWETMEFYDSDTNNGVCVHVSSAKLNQFIDCH